MPETCDAGAAPVTTPTSRLLDSVRRQAASRLDRSPFFQYVGAGRNRANDAQTVPNETPQGPRCARQQITEVKLSKEVKTAGYKPVGS